MSRYELTRWTGLAGLTSGLLIIVGALSVPFVEPVVSGTLVITGHILLIFLLTGIYGIAYSHTGIIGLSGYVLSTIGNVLFVMTQTISSLVVSRIGDAEEMFPAAIPVTGIVFSAGLLLSAIAITRVRALPAWPGWLMFTGVALNLLLPQVINDAPDLVFAIPHVVLGLGIVGFGWELRRN